MAIIQNAERRTKKGKLVGRAVIVILAVDIIIQFFPMLWMILGTFKSDAELTSAIPTVFPSSWSAEAYREAFSKYHVLGNLINTFYIIIMVMLIQVTNSALSGFALAALRPRCGKYMLSFFTATLMFSGTALMFPTYIMMTKMGLIGSKWAVILASRAWAYPIILFKTFFEGIPRDLLEAAKIDGASTFKVLCHIYLPLSKPIFAVNIVNTFTAVYNDFVFPSMLLPEQKDWTLMIRLFILDASGGVSVPTMYVLLVVATVPTFVLYMFMQKYITENVATAGIKG